jgi:hypothetical protein
MAVFKKLISGNITQCTTLNFIQHQHLFQKKFVMRQWAMNYIKFSNAALTPKLSALSLELSALSLPANYFFIHFYW